MGATILVLPLQDGIWGNTYHLGRCPGLMCGGPSGLRMSAASDGDGMSNGEEGGDDPAPNESNTLAYL